ncbi:MAG: type-F conjugative transfer system protein TraW [Gammaproteobacteria bacterium]|nr:type-F conjugative transfer system protein TraW [Gammaproteobacteria bacterium]
MCCSEPLRHPKSQRHAGRACGIVALVLLSASTADAQDLGIIGPVYAIAEPSLLEVIHTQLHALEASGALARLQHESQTRITREISDPAPLTGIAKTTRARSFHFDPSIEVPYPITDAEGRVLVAPGTRVNPLDTVSLSRPLLFFDARDKTQVDRAERLLDEHRGGLKLILTGGSYLNLMRRLKQPVFFDQHGSLTTKLGIRHVPALVTQDGKQLRIDELL